SGISCATAVSGTSASGVTAPNEVSAGAIARSGSAFGLLAGDAAGSGLETVRSLARFAGAGASDTRFADLRTSDTSGADTSGTGPAAKFPVSGSCTVDNLEYALNT
ncbi:MAG TPA: hypothetical protein VFI43_08805, partial [Nitrosospira sp.]|nr:hypothetical protein [Nitrosospira sp.]